VLLWSLAFKPDLSNEAHRAQFNRAATAYTRYRSGVAAVDVPAMRYALALAAIALASLPATAAAASAEANATVMVRAGRLTLVDAPAGVRSLQCASEGGYSAVLPSLQVVDATGSGRGWSLTVHGAALSVRGGSYNGPADLAPRAGAGVVVAYASRNGGMGTTVLRLAVFAGTPRVTLRFVLTQGPA
jgi:hypothetical protein